ncbi:transmembrane protein 138 [Halyomorpha halys]|uniref:transmembrane protein 138 n=1 Tax=Halyomorpha halys TaxID=286706 RepID=UPI0006D4CCB9|nr:transmembrane protein 138 [Halyomorpha halys]XP_014284560.1 transmembrane protein 138 [Halyomorpha halys]
MKLSNATFSTTILFQLLFILADIACNAISDKFVVRKKLVTLLVIYVVQDALILISITLVSFGLFRTNVFKNGFLGILLRRFKLPLIFSIIYLLVTLGLQTDILLSREEEPYFWGNGIDILYIAQRLVAVLYYYFIKRTALRLADPRFYDPEWLKHALAHENVR